MAISMVESARLCVAGYCAHPSLPPAGGWARAWTPPELGSQNSSALPFSKCCICNGKVDGCSNSRGEEHVLVALLGATRLPQTPIYFEVGGLDGIFASNTLYFQHCLRWRGILMEGAPQNFRGLVVNRPGIAAIGSAARWGLGAAHRLGPPSGLLFRALPQRMQHLLDPSTRWWPVPGRGPCSNLGQAPHSREHDTAPPASAVFSPPALLV